jgi:hypothetical protein
MDFTCASRTTVTTSARGLRCTSCAAPATSFSRAELAVQTCESGGYWTGSASALYCSPGESMCSIVIPFFSSKCVMRSATFY